MGHTISISRAYNDIWAVGSETFHWFADLIRHRFAEDEELLSQLEIVEIFNGVLLDDLYQKQPRLAIRLGHAFQTIAYEIIREKHSYCNDPSKWTTSQEERLKFLFVSLARILNQCEFLQDNSDEELIREEIVKRKARSLFKIPQWNDLLNLAKNKKVFLYSGIDPKVDHASQVSIATHLEAADKSQKQGASLPEFRNLSTVLFEYLSIVVKKWPSFVNGQTWLLEQGIDALLLRQAETVITIAKKIDDFIEPEGELPSLSLLTFAHMCWMLEQFEVAEVFIQMANCSEDNTFPIWLWYARGMKALIESSSFEMPPLSIRERNTEKYYYEYLKFLQRGMQLEITPEMLANFDSFFKEQNTETTTKKLSHKIEATFPPEAQWDFRRESLIIFWRKKKGGAN